MEMEMEGKRRTEDRLGRGILGKGMIDWERKRGIDEKRMRRKKRGDRTEEKEEEWKKRRV